MKSNRGRLRAWYEAFAAVGIDFGLWYFPQTGLVPQLRDRLIEAVAECHGKPAWLLGDPEVYLKYKGGPGVRADDWTLSTGMRQAPGTRTPGDVPAAAARQPEAISRVQIKGSYDYVKAEAAAIVQAMLDAANEHVGVGITSYGLPHFHPNFIWEGFAGVGFGSPQLYSSTPQQVDRGIGDWRKLVGPDGGQWIEIIPSIPTFGDNSGHRLHYHLSNFVDGDEDVNGFIAWSWQQTDAQEWDILARWADWFERGIPHTPHAIGGPRHIR